MQWGTVVWCVALWSSLLEHNTLLPLSLLRYAFNNKTLKEALLLADKPFLYLHTLLCFIHVLAFISVVLFICIWLLCLWLSSLPACVCSSFSFLQGVVLYSRDNRELDLLLFWEVCDFVSRVDRVLSRPGGSLLLAGRSGVGRHTATCLVSHMHGYTLFTPKVSRGYSLKHFSNDLKSVSVCPVCAK